MGIAGSPNIQSAVQTALFFHSKEYLSLFAPEMNVDGLIEKKNTFPDDFTASIMPFANKIRLQFGKYLEVGGFPHLYSEKEELHNKFIKEDILDKVIFRDLVELYRIREPSYLEKLFYYLGRNTSPIINLTTLSQSLGISMVAVERYISYLERAMLYFRLPKFSKSPKESLRSNPKGHLIDPALGNLFGADPDQIYESVIASFVFSKLRKNIFFWRDQFHEVDILVEDKQITPIEIKNSGNKTVPNNMIYFMERERITRGYVVYNGEFQKVKMNKKEILLFPAWYFLLH